MHNGPFQNFLLARLRAADLDLLRPRLHMKALRRRQVLERPGERITHAFFMESGLASVIAVAPDDRRIEVGMIGYEGMTAIGALLGSSRAVNETMVQNEGAAACIAVADLQSALMTSPPLKDSLLKYVEVFIGQMSHTALATGQCNIAQRTARWLLMWRDRIDGDELPVTHALLSEMLGVRRPSATVTIHELEERGLIRSTRSRITILDRDGLIALTRGCYGAPEAAYDRVIGVRPGLAPGSGADDAKGLRYQLMELDALCERAGGDPLLQAELAAQLAPEASCLKASSGLDSRADRLLASAAVCAGTARDRIAAARDRPDDRQALLDAELAIANLRQMLVTAIDALEREAATRSLPA